MAPRPLFLIAFLALLAALLALTFADTAAIPPEELAGGCADWWCSERNTWPIGLALGFGGICAVAFAIGAVGLLQVPDDGEGEPGPDDRPGSEPRPAARSLRATRRRDHS